MTIPALKKRVQLGHSALLARDGWLAFDETRLAPNLPEVGALWIAIGAEIGLVVIVHNCVYRIFWEACWGFVVLIKLSNCKTTFPRSKQTSKNHVY